MTFKDNKKIASRQKRLPQLFRNGLSWVGPDLIELPSKVVIYSLLLVELSKTEFGVLSLAMLIMSYQALVQFGSQDWLMFELPKRWAEKMGYGSS